jgi:DNA-binding NarL/FixJ family response regulator
MRQALAVTIRAHWPAARIAEAADFPQAWATAEAGADLCLVDLAMPGAEPLEGVARLQERLPDAAILVTTGLAEAPLLAAVRGLGVAGLIPKTLDPEATVAAIRNALQGRSIDMAPQPALPPRQAQVLQLIAQGLTNKEIAARLGIAPATIKIHVSALLANLGAANRTRAVAEARRKGLV